MHLEKIYATHMHKKFNLLMGFLYVVATAYLLKARIDHSGVGSARGVGFTAVLGVVSYLSGIGLYVSGNKRQRLFGVILIVIGGLLLMLQVWFRFTYLDTAQ